MSAASERLGPYALEAPLGRGGAAQVWRARAPDGSAVAIKRLLPARERDAEARELLLNEAELLRLVQHPNVVRLLEVGGLGTDAPYLVLELVDGLDLQQLLARCRRHGIELPVDVALRIVHELLVALAHLHGVEDARGRPLALVHGDVTPSNVLLGRSGEVKLADLGVARARGLPEARAEHLGKAAYRSPELLEGRVDAGVDLWAAGVVLFEALSLQLPFEGQGAEALTAEVRARRVRPLREALPQASEELAVVAHRALAPVPSQRYQRADRFARALEALWDERVATPLAVAAVVRGLVALP